VNGPDGVKVPSPDDAFGDLARPSAFAVVGLGGAGSDAVHDLVGLGLPNVRTFAVNTDARHLNQVRTEERILLGQRQFRGAGSGGNRSRVLEAATESGEELVRRLSKFEIVFLLAGLGGGTGSALLPFFTSLLRPTETVAVPVAFLPFQVELDTNPDRRENVVATLAELEALGGLLLILSNEKLRRFETLPLPRIFHLRSTYLHSLVASLVDMVENPSQLNVDLASLKSHLRDSGVSTLLRSEHHISEPEHLVQQALAETMLDFELADAPSALVHLDGGSNLTLRTLDRVLRSLRGRLGEPRRLLFGTRMHPERRDVVRMTAVVGGLRPWRIAERAHVPV
jgi:cell division protein FtsZ